MALGARRRDILGIVLGQGIRLAAAGVALGVVLALAAARAMGALLASVGPADGATLAVAGALCLAMVIAGCFFPALHAARADPMTAIKAE
jgi:putative ABC transport system permease protein